MRTVILLLIVTIASIIQEWIMYRKRANAGAIDHEHFVKTVASIIVFALSYFILDWGATKMHF